MTAWLPSVPGIKGNEMTLSRRTLLGAGSVAMAGLAAAPATAAPAKRTGSLEAATDAAVEAALKAGACAGVAVALWRDGKALLDKGYGAANLETATAVEPHSIFRIGSLTKQFTAAAVVKLSAQGRVKLDAPVAQYLKCFAPLAAVTLYELLTHTAGLHSDDSAPVCLPADGKSPSQTDLARAIAAQAKPFDFPPGTAWLYSNANYIVLGAVIEAVAGTPLHEAMRSLLFEPLGLNATAFDRAEDVVRGRVSGYTPGATAGTFVNAAYIPVAQAGGAGAMRSTAGELCAWHHKLFGGALFDAAQLRKMTTPGQLRDGRLSGAHRFSPQDAVYGDTQYGFGLLLPPPVKGQRSVLHYGAIDGFGACLETYPDRAMTLAVLCNADMNPVLPIRALRHVVIDQLL